MWLQDDVLLFDYNVQERVNDFVAAALAQVRTINNHLIKFHIPWILHCKLKINFTIIGVYTFTSVLWVLPTFRLQILVISYTFQTIYVHCLDHDSLNKPFVYSLFSATSNLCRDLTVILWNVQSKHILFFQANVTRTNHIMWMMGTDFRYQYANSWFRQMDKFIHYVNQVFLQGPTN